MEKVKLKYAPEVFEKKSIDDAKNIILTSERGIDSKKRWEIETPYLIESIGSKTNLNKNSLVVDFGCGIGRVSKELIKKFDCEVVGVDMSSSMRKHAMQYVNSKNFTVVSVEEFKSMLYNGVRFDLALAVWVLQHCIKPLIEISLLRSALKPNGSLYVLNNINMAIPTNKGWISKDIDIFQELENQLELQVKAKLPKSAGNEYISKYTYEGFYKKTESIKLVNHIQAIFKQIRKLKEKRKFQEVIQNYIYLLQIDPLNFNIYNNLGMVYENLGENSKAIEAYKQAVRINPKFSKAVNNIAVILYKQKRYDESADIFQVALDIDPNYNEVYSNMGAALNKAKRYSESIKALELAIEKMPNHGGAYTNLGNVYNKLHEYKKAQKLHEKSIQLEPNGANAYSNLASSLKNQGLNKEAIKNYRKAIEINPGFENAHFDLATTLLTIGEFQEGFKEYEWRFKKEEMKGHILNNKDIFSKPMFTADKNIEDKILLLHSEQGFGDSIQFIRFLPKLKEKYNCKIAVKCRDELKELFKGVDEIDILTNRSEPTPKFDYHLPIMSMPYVLDIKSTSQIPFKNGYLKAKKDEQFKLEKKKGKLNIGICWSASVTGESYEGKVFDLKYFEKLIKNENINVYSLQVGPENEDIKKLGYEDDVIDLTSRLTNFAKTASLMNELDLVISSDTSVAHLAGALNVPVWIPLQKFPDWRWQNKGETSPWYGSAKLFRQKTNGVWDSVFQSVYDKLFSNYKIKL